MNTLSALALALAAGPASAGDDSFFLLSGKSLTCLRDLSTAAQNSAMAAE